MRILSVLVVLACLLWGGYWLVGANGIERALAGWIEDRRDEGWVAEYSELRTRGFPNRFDTTITDLQLADPQTGLAWTMPFFQILTLSYTPNHIIVAFPDDQVIASPLEKVTMESGLMRGSVVFVPDTSLAVGRTSFELTDLQVTSSKGWTTSIENGQLASRLSGVGNSYDIYFEASNVRPPDQLLGLFDPARVLPDIFEGVKIDVNAEFDAPWDRFALEQRRPQPISVELREFDAGWGEITLQAAGSLEVDVDGWPRGRIDIRARNWREMLRMARETGLLPANIAPTVENALDILAGMTGNPETLDAPLVFRGRTMFFGGLPVGPSPNMAIR